MGEQTEIVYTCNNIKTRLRHRSTPPHCHGDARPFAHDDAGNSNVVGITLFDLSRAESDIWQHSTLKAFSLFTHTTHTFKHTHLHKHIHPHSHIHARTLTHARAH